MSISVHMASVLQIKQGSFLSHPGLHQEVGLSLIRPSSIKLFRDVSKMFNVKAWMQHLKKPPFFLQSLAKLDFSWKSKVLKHKSFVTGTYIFCTLLETLCVVLWMDVLPVPRVDTDIGKPIRLFPSLLQAFRTLCEVPQHLWVVPIVEVVVILEFRVAEVGALAETTKYP